MPRPFPHPPHQAGFSLLEMAAVLMIIAILTAGTLSVGSSVIESAREVSTNNKLDAIQEALLAFRLANNRLPCPGDATLTDIAANANTYGYEAGYNAANNPASSCNGGSPTANYFYTLPATPPANTNIPNGTTIAEGAVPVKSLDLPDEFQYDGWGRKFAYAVWTPLTATNAFITYGASPSCGSITVENAGHGYRTTAGAYALISFGPNGHGGYLQNGSRYFTGSDNADEWTNCHCNATNNVVNTSSNAPAAYVEQEPTQTNPNDSYSVFDDIVRFNDRWQMQNAYDGYVPNGAPCWPGGKINGVNANDESGYSITVGDVNGDGIPDLIIGAPNANGGAGAVYVVFGTKSGFPDPLPLSSLNGRNGFELDGAAGSSDAAGTSVAVGDVNGDGIPDLIIGAYSASPNGNSWAGSVYVVFGGLTGANDNSGTTWTSCPCTLDATYLNGTNGVEFDGAAANDEVGWSVAAGDINGDGLADLIIGAPTYSAWTGSVYEVFGKRSGWSGTATTLNSTFLNGTNGVEFDGVSSNRNTGISVAAGDVNGDGLADLIIGADKVNSYSGAVYVVFGTKCGGSFAPCSPAVNTLNSAFPNGTNAVEFDGAAANDEVGWSVAAGDINGDGIPDLIIGAPGANSNAGKVYVVFGTKCGGSFAPCSPTVNTLNSAFLNGTNGTEFEGTAANTYTGYSVAVGDVNDDGIADLIIGKPHANSLAGKTYVYFGHKATTLDPWPATPFNLGGL